MTTRREAITLAALGGVAALARPGRTLADHPPSAEARLETWLFNLKDGLSPEQTFALIADVRDRARRSASGGVLLGRNFVPDPFPARFEWICMAQFPSDDRRKGFDEARDALAASWRNAVRCELDRPLPARYADAAGIKVRHTVMFNFTPEASDEARARNVAAIRAMGRLPMVQGYLVDRNPSFVAAPDQMEWQVIGDFASVADYQAYSHDPAHLALREDFRAHTSRVAFLDVQP